jgi:uncharacterized iron-regulated membrane protein
VFACTGILLNYKGPIFETLGLTAAPVSNPRRGSVLSTKSIPRTEARLTTTRGFAAAAVSAERVVEIARDAWGDVPLDRIELKAERGGVVWKVKAKTGTELLIDGVTGSVAAKGPYERLGPPGADGAPQRSTDWGKLLLDLHTGKIGGEVGKAAMTVAAFGLLFLTLSGLYLWLKPVLIRRANARQRERTQPVMDSVTENTRLARETANV